MMSLSQKIQIEREIRSRKIQQEAHDKYYYSLANFVKDSWHIVEPITPYVSGWAIEALCEHLQAVTDGKLRNLLINVPPGMMKSLLVNVFWPAWEWGVRKLGHYRYICTAHSADLAIRDNVRARRLICSDWYKIRFPHIEFAKDQNAKGKFENTLMGFREATAARSVTGSRGDRFLIDDPISVYESNSETVLNSTRDWFKEAVPTRLNKPDSSSIIVIMQRLHDKDVSGIILSEKMDFEHLCLPMEFEIETKCRTKIGFEDPRKIENELLFPERFPRHVVDKLKSVLGSYATAGQLQQRPVPRGGGIIKYEWLQFVANVPTNFTYKILSYDTAFKDGEQNAYSVGTVWGVINNTMYLIDTMRERLQLPELLTNIEKMMAKHLPHAVLIEDKASGQSIIQVLKRKFGAKIKAVPADRDKITRAHAITHLFENNQVFFVENAASSAFIDELTKFPYSSFSDVVDSTTQGLCYLDKMRNPGFRQQPTDYMSHIN